MAPVIFPWHQDRWDRICAQVRTYRHPSHRPYPGWQYGCDPHFLHQFCEFWTESFDAKAAMAEINKMQHFVGTIDGTALHWIHIVGEAEGKRPLLLVHGWPGTFYEFSRVVEKLAFPSRYGGKREDAFDVVVPSIPGFGFSPPPATVIGPQVTAKLFDGLMRDVLGYPRYRVHGTDYGAVIGAWLGLEYANSLIGIHLSLIGAQPNGSPATPEELAWKAAFDIKQRQLGAYSALQSTKPQSLAYAMADNPVAQASWLIERLHDWTDQRRRSFDRVVPLDRLMKLIMIYLITGSFESSIWFYVGAVEDGSRALPLDRRVDVPTAFAAFPDPRWLPPPRSWAERGYHIVRWSEPPEGGHFAAFEVPDLWLSDIREWAANQ